MCVHVLTKLRYFTKNSAKNGKLHKHFLTQTSTDNQRIRKHTDILTVFAISDERVLLTMLPAKLNNCSH